MSRNIKIDKSMPKPRNPMAAIVKMQFKASYFDHKAEARGGDRNLQADFLEDCLDMDDDLCDCDD